MFAAFVHKEHHMLLKKKVKKKKEDRLLILPYSNSYSYSNTAFLVISMSLRTYFVMISAALTPKKDRHILARTVKVRGLEPPHAFVSNKFRFLPPLADLKLVTYRVVVTSFGQRRVPSKTSVYKSINSAIVLVIFAGLLHSFDV